MLSEILRSARMQACLSQAQILEATQGELGFTKTGLSRWESGRRLPSRPQLDRLLDVLEVKGEAREAAMAQREQEQLEQALRQRAGRWGDRS